MDDDIEKAAGHKTEKKRRAGKKFRRGYGFQPD
jgi:hypothetical protein